MACIQKNPLVSTSGKVDLFKFDVTFGETHPLLT